MRIVYVIEQLSGIGGMEHVLTDKLNYLVEHTNHEIVLLLVWYDKAPIAYHLDERVKIVRLNIHRRSKLLSPKLIALHKFDKVIKQLNPDVTIYLWVLGAFLAAFTSWRGASIYESHQPVSTMRHRWVIDKAAKKVSVVVSLTQGDACAFRKANDVRVIPNFTDLSTDALPDYSQKNIVFVGRNSPEKDIPRLYRLWDEVHRSHPEWNLSVHHQTKDIVTAYLNGSILVMTSKMEGFGLVLIEAQRCGLPCVAFDCPYGPREIIKDGETGYLIPYNDDNMFVSKLSTLMDNEDLRRQMGQQARVDSNRFAKHTIMSKWIDLINTLANA